MTYTLPLGFLGQIAKLFNRPNPGQAAPVLFPGVVRPTYTLAQMVAADIIANGYKYEEDPGNAKKRESYRSEARLIGCRDYGTYYFTVKTKPLTLRFSASGRELHNKSFCSTPVAFDAAERQLIREAMTKWDSLAFERDKAESHAKNQQAALDAIEKFMGIGKFAKTEGMIEHKSKNGCEFSCCKPKPSARSSATEFEEESLLSPVKE